MTAYYPRMNCALCTISIEAERLELLPDTKVCSCCARNGAGQKSRPKGVVIYGHKTAGAIQILSPENFAEHRRYNPYGRHTGRGSGVHRMMSSSEK